LLDNLPVSKESEAYSLEQDNGTEDVKEDTSNISNKDDDGTPVGEIAEHDACVCLDIIQQLLSSEQHVRS
jgi:hypothetical protein